MRKLSSRKKLREACCIFKHMEGVAKDLWDDKYGFPLSHWATLYGLRVVEDLFCEGRPDGEA